MATGLALRTSRLRSRVRLDLFRRSRAVRRSACGTPIVDSAATAA